jgi:hypothetical protein
MNKFLLAGVMGTMLALSNCTPASARDRFEYHRPGLTTHYDRDRLPSRGYVDRFAHLDRDYCDPYRYGGGIGNGRTAYRGITHRLTYRW